MLKQMEETGTVSQSTSANQRCLNSPLSEHTRYGFKEHLAKRNVQTPNPVAIYLHPFEPLKTRKMEFAPDLVTAGERWCTAPLQREKLSLLSTESILDKTRKSLNASGEHSN